MQTSREVHTCTPGLLPVRHCPRRASLAKPVRDRRATGHRGKLHAARTREDGLDKPRPESRGVRTYREQGGHGTTLSTQGLTLHDDTSDKGWRLQLATSGDSYMATNTIVSRNMT